MEMRWKAALAGALIAAPAWAQAPTPGERETGAGMTAVTPAEAWMIAGAAPARSLQAARTAFDQQKPKLAAHAMREAAALLHLQAMQGTPEVADLDAAAAQLWRTSDRLMQGETVPRRELDDTLARASYVESRYHHEMARQLQSRGDKTGAAVELGNAAVHLQHGATWAGKETLRGVRTAAGDAFELAGDVTRATGWVPEKIGAGITAVGRGIDRLGQDVKGGEIRRTRGTETAPAELPVPAGTATPEPAPSPTY